MYDIFALGDIIVDLTPCPASESGNPVYECNPGGTVANMAVSTARMGLKTLLAGCVGDEDLGRHVEKVIAGKGVDTSGVVFDADHFSTLAVITLKNGERSFSFSRKYAADINLKIEDVDMQKLLSSKIFHVSGMCFSDDPCKNTAFYAMEKAREAKIITTLDVNYRPLLWRSEDDFRQTLADVIRKIDIYKSSEEEILLITGENTLDRAAEKISSWGPRLVLVSCGPKGAYFYYRGQTGTGNTFDTVRVDTTGAGDCFMGAVLYKIINRNGTADFQYDELLEILEFANAAGAVSISRRGGVASMPGLDEIAGCMKNTKKLVIPW
ncbi:MAG: carbohydrate kinase [Treponema sp.]|jgi:sugar/nucleoside kinase (ribokinase family)|nr:carbohydrate kinase [Treponema sp.]